jgi:tRNA(fMet)-specific endonuclease VapC
LIDTFVGSVQVLAFDGRAAGSFAAVAAGLDRRGTPIGAFDSLIAGHAPSLALTLVTRNGNHFSRAHGLKTENWFVA